MPRFSSKSGFTLIELLVAIGVVVVLATLAIVNFANARVTSRDGRRKTDVQTILSAVTQYYAANGNTFIQDVDPNTHQKPGCAIAAGGQATDTPASGAGCVGALGRAYGKINLKNATSSGYGSTTTMQFAGRAYAPVSIANALVDGGFLASVPTDPSANSSVTNDPNQRDYVLVRGCRNGGNQAIGTNGSIFAVWAALENTPTSAELTKSNQYAGGSAIAAAQSNGNPYQYDFAAQQAEFDAGFYTTNGYAVGNGGATALSDAAGCAGTSALSANS